MLELLKTYFKNQDWHYVEDDSNTLFFLEISGENGKFNCVADIKEDENTFIFLSILNVYTSEDKRLFMAELLTRLNYSEFFGNFDLDFEDGEVRYRTSILYGNIKPDIELINNLIMTNLIIMDKCMPGIIGLMYKNLTPAVAYSLIMESHE